MSVKALLSASILSAVIAPASVADQPLTFLYEDYPPFTYVKDGRVVGNIPEQVEAIAARAGVTIDWQPSTYSRMLRVVTDGESKMPVCIAGYNSTPDREGSSWVSKPFAMSPRSGIAVLQENLTKFDGHTTIESIFEDPNISGAFLQGASYGDRLTGMIEAGRERHLFIGGDDNDLAVMVVRGRVDFAMVNAQQVDYLREVLPGGEKLVALMPEGMKEPEADHIICSKGLPEDLRARLNTAIEAQLAD